MNEVESDMLDKKEPPIAEARELMGGREIVSNYKASSLATDDLARLALLRWTKLLLAARSMADTYSTAAAFKASLSSSSAKALTFFAKVFSRDSGDPLRSVRAMVFQWFWRVDLVFAIKGADIQPIRPRVKALYWGNYLW